MSEQGHAAENDARREVQTQFLRDGEWLPHVLIRRSEIGRVKFRHRIVTITEHRGEWRQGRAPHPATFRPVPSPHPTPAEEAGR